MEILIIIACLIAGYLFGSVSFARVVMKVVAPGQKLEGIELDVPGSDYKIRDDAVSGTAVSNKLGSNWGCLTAWLDILKVLIPALVLRLVFRETPYYLVFSAAAVLGHNWPVYYRFKGGNGLSPIIGSYFVIDPLGTVVVNVAGLLFGLVIVKNIFISYMAGISFMIPWVWFLHHDFFMLGYTVFVNIIFLIAMIPGFRVMIDMKKRGIKVDWKDATELTPMGRSMNKMFGHFRFRRKQ
jgi:glycerol-3-phosphate acyltransferase PlsY